MSFTSLFDAQRKKYGAMSSRDVLKLCHQAAYGPEHLIEDVAAAKQYFDAEFRDTPSANTELCEPISDRFCRVHLGAWKAKDLPADWLFSLFLASAKPTDDAKERLEEYLAVAARVMGDPRLDADIRRYRESGTPAVRHSQAYRAAYAPAYRVVDRRLWRLMPLLEHIALQKDDPRPIVIAIDGRAASGKSTAAAFLSQVLGAPIVRMDDFFLPLHLRTEQRLSEAGGNVHYERFEEQVLPGLRANTPFCYQRFDCSVMDYAGQVSIPAAPVRIVEGCYCLHPRFGSYADLSVFMDVDADEQLRRIEKRNGTDMLHLFRTRWIPMEENYFEACDVEHRAILHL